MEKNKKDERTMNIIPYIYSQSIIVVLVINKNINIQRLIYIYSRRRELNLLTIRKIMCEYGLDWIVFSFSFLGCFLLLLRTLTTTTTMYSIFVYVYILQCQQQRSYEGWFFVFSFVRFYANELFSSSKLYMKKIYEKKSALWIKRDNNNNKIIIIDEELQL